MINFLFIVMQKWVRSPVVFWIVKAVNRLDPKKEEAPEEPKGPTTEELLTEIRDLLKEK